MVVGGCYSGLSGHKSKKVTNSERSASQIYRVRHRLGAESKDLGGAYPTRAVGILSTTEARTWRTRHGSKILHRLGDGT